MLSIVFSCALLDESQEEINLAGARTPLRASDPESKEVRTPVPYQENLG